MPLITKIVSIQFIGITDLGIPFIFKASFKKANRTRLDSFTGIGDNNAIEILKNVKETLKIPVTTDVHNEDDINKVKDIVDIIQIPAFLSRQTDLLISAAKTDKFVNIKKGQFLSPESMRFAVDKIKSKLATAATNTPKISEAAGSMNSLTDKYNKWAFCGDCSLESNVECN